MTTATQDATACDRCGRHLGPPHDGRFHPPIMYVPRLIPAYWGEALCPDCCQLAVTIHDLAGWPPLPDADAAG